MMSATKDAGQARDRWGGGARKYIATTALRAVLIDRARHALLPWWVAPVIPLLAGLLVWTVVNRVRGALLEVAATR
jgi:hypothetical protein